jgi:SAM-dependent methyltransferase
VAVIEPDYDSDPERRGAWRAPADVFEAVAPEVRGPIVDIGSGEGRLGEGIPDEVLWVGVDASPSMLEQCERRPVVLADMRALPFRDGAFAEAAHLWCLYHLDDPVPAIAEAKRVLRAGGRYFASTSARANDPELVPDGYPASTFDAEEAAAIVGAVFDAVEPDRWDGRYYSLDDADELAAYCRHNMIDPVPDVALPLWLTKRGVLVRATA